MNDEVSSKKIMEVVNNQRGGVFFLYGHGGTRKTYMRRTLASYIRLKKTNCFSGFYVCNCITITFGMSNSAFKVQDSNTCS